MDLVWLLVLRAPDSIEGLRLAGALLGGRAVEVLVADLPERMPIDREGSSADWPPAPGRSVPGS